MICHDCKGIDDNMPNCFRCDGTGSLCDTCGESCEPGSDECDGCAESRHGGIES
jgi:hypothetical protein